MKFSNLTNQAGEWLKSDGQENRIVISSRIRFARNLAGIPFPGWAKKAMRVEVMERVKPEVEALAEMKDGYSELMQNLSAMEKQILMERHLISREHAAKAAGSAVVVNRRQTLSIMINEEDHLRMQSLRPGLQLKAAYKQIDKVDSALEAKLDYAFSEQLGYLTACPSNVGTGMRASAMVHLPGLVLGEHINQVIQAVNKIGLAVRGLYGEGTEAMGNLFQVSNQTTLGESEEEIINRLQKVIQQVIFQERNARLNLLQKQRGMLLDQIGRAYGVLRHSHRMASKEALNLLSMIRLGIDLEFFPEEPRTAIDELFMETQPAHLQHSSHQKLSVGERDALRAALVRDKLKTFPEPDTSKAAEDTGTTGGGQPDTDDE